MVREEISIYMDLRKAILINIHIYFALIHSLISPQFPNKLEKLNHIWGCASNSLIQKTDLNQHDLML